MGDRQSEEEGTEKKQHHRRGGEADKCYQEWLVPTPRQRQQRALPSHPTCLHPAHVQPHVPLGHRAVRTRARTLPHSHMHLMIARQHRATSVSLVQFPVKNKLSLPLLAAALNSLISSIASLSPIWTQLPTFLLPRTRDKAWSLGSRKPFPSFPIPPTADLPNCSAQLQEERERRRTLPTGPEELQYAD